MKDQSNNGADRAERKLDSTRFSPVQIAAAGISGAIILLVLMIVVFVMGNI